MKVSELLNGPAVFEVAAPDAAVSFKHGDAGYQIPPHSVTSLVDLDVPVKIDGFFHCENNDIGSLEGGPQIVKDTYQVHDCGLSTLEGANITSVGNYLDISANHFKDLKNIHKHVKEVDGTIFCTHNQEEIKGPVLGILLVKGLKKFEYSDATGTPGWVEIINKYLPNKEGVAALNKCSLELDKAGFETVADI